MAFTQSEKDNEEPQRRHCHIEGDEPRAASLQDGSRTHLPKAWADVLRDLAAVSPAISTANLKPSNGRADEGQPGRRANMKALLSYLHLYHRTIDGGMFGANATSAKVTADSSSTVCVKKVLVQLTC